MDKKYVITGILAGTGTALVWASLVAPFVLGAPSLNHSGLIPFDYAAPARYSLWALAGAGLMMVAAHRVLSRQSMIAWCGAALLFLMIDGERMAFDTGHVEYQAAGYILAFAALGVAGVLLLRDINSGKQGTEEG